MQSNRSACPSCGNLVRTPFCGRCGERQQASDELTWRAQLGHVLGGLFNLDGRLWRSLRVLVFEPGRLAVDYCRGARTRWMRPMQLLLLANVAYFVVQPHLLFNAFPSTLDLQLERNVYSSWLRPIVEARLDELGWTREAYARAFDANVGDLARTLLILLVPLTAVVMQLVALGRGRRLIEHVVLATHLLSAHLLVVHVLLVGLVSAGLRNGWIHYSEDVGMIANLALLALWLLFAWRRFHRAGWRRSALAATVITLSWVPTIIAYRFALFWISYWTVG